MAAQLPALLVKAAKDGGLGDCPFAHYACMCLHLAGARYELRPTRRDDKPAWHLAAPHNGSMPCLCPAWPDGAGATSESGAIARGALPPTPADEAALDAFARARVFACVAAFLKSPGGPDAAGEPAARDARAALDAALGACAAHLEATRAPWFSGEAPGHADAWICTKARARARTFRLPPRNVPSL